MDSSIGQVVDLSSTGARVLSKRRLAGTQTISVTGADRKPLRLAGRVVWHRMLGPGNHVHGLKFENLTQDQHAQLDKLCNTLQKDNHAPISLMRYGLSGVVMLAIAAGLTAAAFAWMQHNAAIASAAPKLHQALRVIPELGALLLIAASGCALLGLAQRLVAPPAAGLATKGKSNKLEPLIRSQSVLNCILESSLGGVVVLETVREKDDTIDGFQIQLINPAGERLIGKTEKQLVGQTLEKTLPGLTQHQVYKDLQAIVGNGRPLQREYQIGDDGRWFLVAMVRLADGIAITFMDNTESQKQRQQLEHIAYHDELTGLPNRKALIEHIDSAISRTQRSPGHHCALLFLDFDRFKHVNDTLGHEAGDQLLINIAHRLHDNLRETDTLRLPAGSHLPARLGGDEFVILLDGIHEPQDAVVVAKRLLAVFAQPHTIAGQQVTSTASIGVAVNQGLYESAEDILRDADAAMYTAKQTGKSRYVLFNKDMQEQIRQRLQMEKDLRSAVERDELSLAYEPIIDLQTGKTAGFEALVRWTHPEYGAVSPAQFIPLAEELNIIGEIGEWVLHHACAQLQQWKQAGVNDIFLNVNLSRGQLYEPNLVELFAHELDSHGINPQSIRVELTETMVMNDLDFMADKLSQLKQLGVGLALDDFGTGYSSLAVLHKLPFDTLKIDRAFLDDARAIGGKDQTRRSSAIISAITDLADHLRLDVIAEGIAEHEQVATLQALACRYAQGWHFSKPLPPDQALALLNNPTPHRSCLASELNIPA